MEDYKSFQIQCEKTKEQNSKLIEAFGVWLRKSNLTGKTIKKHQLNIDFYLNDFLLQEDIIEARDGVDEVGIFLGYWFIKKALWASSSSLKQNAASIKKFYTFMFENNLIDKESLDDLKEEIKENLSEWIATLERFEDDSIENINDVWGF